MGDSLKIEYIITDALDSIYESRVVFIPHVGDRVRIDDKPFRVTDIEPFFYKESCKQNKIRVFLETLKES